jgi:hypothetical protein
MDKLDCARPGAYPIPCGECEACKKAGCIVTTPTKEGTTMTAKKSKTSLVTSYVVNDDMMHVTIFAPYKGGERIVANHAIRAPKEAIILATRLLQWADEERCRRENVRLFNKIHPNVVSRG